MTIAQSSQLQPNMSSLISSKKNSHDKIVHVDEIHQADQGNGRSEDLQLPASLQGQTSYLFSCFPSPSSIFSSEDNNGVIGILLGKCSRDTSATPRESIARIRHYYWLLMITSVAALLVGGSVAWLLGRLYFIHGGSRRWLYACLQSMGWPILLFPLSLSYCYNSIRPFAVTPLTIKTVFLFTMLGGIATVDNLLYSWGQSNLPVSTDSLLCSSQLAFSAVLACVLLKQKMSHYMINAFVLITTSTVVLIIHPHSHSTIKERKFIIGCVVTVAASALYAFMLTFLELIYIKVVQKRSFVVVLEIQMIISIAATFFSMLGMWINGDLAEMQQEATEFGLGRGAYAATLLGSAIGWQLYIVGGAGIIFLASSLMSSVLMTAMLPLIPVLAVIFFHDAITAEKLISLFLALWGFTSYIYGAYAATVIRDETCRVDDNEDNVLPQFNNAQP